MRILIVDDEIHVAMVLADAVKLQGHEATIASDGEEGLALIARQRPDAVFLDVRLGELDGVHVLRRIRRTDSALPVVLITGQATDQQLEEARALGVTEVIEKPFFLARLTDALGAMSTGARPDRHSDR